ncbi:MAG: hypothetical protein HXS46_19175 [Theionarchaea archaeon]|nr:hypothetical protein [Theionarchaea archaeon]
MGDDLESELTFNDALEVNNDLISFLEHLEKLALETAFGKNLKDCFLAEIKREIRKLNSSKVIIEAHNR